MKLLIEIDANTMIEERAGTDKNGNAYLIRKQPGWLEFGAKYPVQVMLRLESGEQPHPPGRYDLAPQSIRSGKYGDIEFNPVLLPMGGKQ